ncbi:MAG: protein kinase domain-containing protein [Planctomycetota bacterium]
MRPEDIAEAPLPEVPGYRAISAVGAGSHGVVFRARDLAAQDVVALKVLRPEYARALSAPPLARARRGLEERIARLGALSSRALVVPREAAEFSDEEGGRRLALVMPFIEGDSLARALQRNVRFEPARASGLASDVARALGAAHEAGLVHGALHPGKIILTGTDDRDGGLRRAQSSRGGEARVLGAGLGETLPPDFDDPRAVVRLSPHVYAASEVLAGDLPGEAADVFSLGAILYHVLTGLAPYRARSLAALKVERADGPPVWPRGATDELPAPLVHLVDRMMNPAAAARPRLDSRMFSELSGSARSRRPSAFRRASDRPTPPPPRTFGVAEALGGRADVRGRRARRGIPHRTGRDRARDS